KVARAILASAHEVRFPDVLRQRAGHAVRPLGLPPPETTWALDFQSHVPRRQYRGMDDTSGVGVLDKAASVLGALEAGPATLAQLVSSTGLARPTAHRLAVALEHHRLVARDMQGRFVLGPRLNELATAAGE